MPSPRQTKSLLERLFSFDEFVTPKIMRGVYFLGLALLVLFFIVSALTYIPILLTVLSGRLSFLVLVPVPFYLLGLFFAAVQWRVCCELILVLFKINSNLERLKSNSDFPRIATQREQT